MTFRLFVLMALGSFVCSVQCLWSKEYSVHDARNSKAPENFRYFFRWKIDEVGSIITVNITAADTNGNDIGYVALGIAGPNGGAMPGSDIAICSHEGEVKDYFATGYQSPILDATQHWRFIGLNKGTGFLSCQMSRKLNTNDNQDHPLINPFGQFDSVNWMFAYGQVASDGHPIYHGQNVATAQINLNSNRDMWRELEEMPDFDLTWDMTRDNYEVAPDSTTYVTKCYNYDNSLGARSMIAASPLININPKSLIHHFVVKGYPETDCQGSTGDIVNLWAPGLDVDIMPENLGITVGESGIQSFDIQTHYNNPNNLQGIKDNSGVRLWFTAENKLRPVEMGILRLADPDVQMASQDLINPNGYSSYTFNCPEMLNKLPHAITAFKMAHHMHISGVEAELNLTRQGQVVGQYRADYFDFTFQNFINLNTTILPGDSFSTRCSYNSNIPGSNKKFGFGSNDEMCIDYVFYYPKTTWGKCDFQTPSMKLLSGSEELHRTFGTTITKSEFRLNSAVLVGVASTIVVGILVFVVYRMHRCYKRDSYNVIA